MFTKTKMCLAGTVVATGICVGCYSYGSYNAIQGKMEQLEASNRQQQEYIEQLRAESIQYERFVESVHKELELVLLSEDGITNTIIEKGKNFLTHTETEFAIEYRVKLGIETSDIHFAKRDGKILITVDRDDVEVNSLEIINKNILVNNKKLFGRYMTQEEKNSAEKLIVEKAKEEVLNGRNVDLAIDSLTEYLHGLAEAFDVNVEIIIC